MPNEWTPTAVISNLHSFSSACSRAGAPPLAVEPADPVPVFLMKPRRRHK